MLIGSLRLSLPFSTLVYTAFVLTSLFPATARATSFSWISPSGQFNAAGNWTQSGFPADPDGIPDAGDTATFDRGNVTLYPVYFGNLLVPNSDIHPTVDRVVIGNNPLNFVGLYGSTLTVDSTNITETARGVVIGAGAGDVAALTSTLATFDTQYATLGSAAGSSGTLNLTSASAGAFSVSGTGATYDLIVGLNGTGAINVSNGRDVSVADDMVLGQNATGVGNVSVSGAGSTWTNTGDFNVGLSGIGTLNVSGGGQVSDATGYLAASSGLTSTATISGAGSTWENSIALIVANHGMATLEVNSGAQVTSSNSGYVGYFADAVGSATVTGTGSTWSNSLSTIVGSSGQGELTISAGGLLSDTIGVVGSVAGSVGTATVSGTSSRWTNSSSLFVGDGSNGTLDVTNGGQVSNVNGYIGDDAGAMGEVSVSGTDSTWTNTGDLYVGYSGSGTVNVMSGGQLNNTIGYIGDDAGSIGDVTVDGTGSTWTNSGDLFVGNAGNGTLNITNGGRVNASGDSYIGATGDSVGAVTVDGATSRWTNDGGITVGGGANATLDVRNGGAVTCLDASVLGQAGSPSFVRLDSSSSLRANYDTFFNPLTGEFSAFGGDFYVYDHTVVEIMNGSSLNDFKATVNGSDTLVHVHGAGSRWSTSEASDYPNSGVLRIDGTLQITNAGTVTASYYMMIGAGSEGIVEISSGGQLITENAAIGQFGGSLGTVTVDGTGSNWNNFATLQVAVDGAGTLSVMNGGAITTVSLQVGTLGEVSGDGSIIGLVQNGGLVSPGTSSGTLTIDGDYAQSAAGELLIELASAVSYDQLQITSIQHPPPSIATLDGTLTVEPLDGFTPSAGQSFTILTADFVTGTFGTEVFPSMPNLAFDVLYNPQSVVLTVLSALPGDYSGNGTVDAADYTVWRNSVGGVSLPNEGASLGTVDDLDYDFWKLHFGETIGSGSGSADFGELSRAGASPSQAAVPEPAALSLMFAALIGAVINRAAPRPGSRR